MPRGKNEAPWTLNAIALTTALLVLMGVFIVVVLPMALETAVPFTGAETAYSYNPDNLVRLHIVAHSNDPVDQDLKLRVRDLIVGEYGGKLSRLETPAAAAEFLGERLSEIQNLAAGEGARAGFSYPVSATYGRFPFPTKAYGDLVLPAGEYSALQVVIGEGQGQNWWCLLFPPLCFVDISRGGMQPSNLANLRELGLSEAEARRVEVLLRETGKPGVDPTNLHIDSDGQEIVLVVEGDETYEIEVRWKSIEILKVWAERLPEALARRLALWTSPPGVDGGH